MAIYKNDANLQGLWLLEEASGTRFDYTPNNNDLTDNNTVGQSTADKKEGAASADFESTNSEWLSINDANQNGLDITGNLTICCWCKPETNGVDGSLVAKYTATGNQRSYALTLSSTGSVRGRLSPDGTNVTIAETTTGQWAAGTWVHVAMVYNGTDIRVYVNGSLVNNGTENPKAYNSGIYNGSAQFDIGAWNAGAALLYDGLIDEVVIFNRELSAAEISDIYTNGIQDPSVVIPIIMHHRRTQEMS